MFGATSVASDVSGRNAVQKPIWYALMSARFRSRNRYTVLCSLPRRSMSTASRAIAISNVPPINATVWPHTVALIGGTFEMAIAREAVLMLLRGSEHKTVYRFLERKRADIKVYQMGF